LKSLIKKKFGHASNADRAIDNLQAKPDSDAWKQILTGEVKVVTSSSDPELVSAAQSLLALIKALPQGEKHTQVAQGTGIAQADRGGTATVTMHAPARGNDEVATLFSSGENREKGVFVRPRPIVRPLSRLTNYS
jgi:hypothetical protein